MRFDLDDCIDVLRQTPATLQVLLEGISEPIERGNEGLETFSPFDVVRQLLAAWVVHDLGHIAQIARVMAKQYRDEVGPWTPFMPVLTDRVIPGG